MQFLFPKLYSFPRSGGQKFYKYYPTKKPGSAPAGAHLPVVKRRVFKAENSPPSRALVNEWRHTLCLHGVYRDKSIFLISTFI